VGLDSEASSTAVPPLPSGGNAPGGNATQREGDVMLAHEAHMVVVVPAMVIVVMVTVMSIAAVMAMTVVATTAVSVVATSAVPMAVPPVTVTVVLSLGRYLGNAGNERAEPADDGGYGDVLLGHVHAPGPASQPGALPRTF
jgi:hypothetical protein